VGAASASPLSCFLLYHFGPLGTPAGGYESPSHHGLWVEKRSSPFSRGKDGLNRTQLQEAEDEPGHSHAAL
jgi:hypothetical protein